MYYDHPFYRLLVRSFRVRIEPDVLVILNREGEEERRVPYAEMSQRELASVCHYVGMLAERLRESL